MEMVMVPGSDVNPVKSPARTAMKDPRSRAAPAPEPNNTKDQAMPLRPCLDCGTLSPGTRCDIHGAVKKRAHNSRYRPHRERRPDYTAAERDRRAATVQAWREVHGDLCPGWNRPAHAVDPRTNPLTADHTQSVRSGGSEAGPLAVLCRSCNSSKGHRA